MIFQYWGIKVVETTRLPAVAAAVAKMTQTPTLTCRPQGEGELPSASFTSRTALQVGSVQCHLVLRCCYGFGGSTLRSTALTRCLSR
jgi:hypothetical protein